MRTHSHSKKVRFLFVLGFAWVVLVSAVAPLQGQTVTVLHDFSAQDAHTLTNSDGAYIDSGLVLSGNTLYGTASSGGAYNNGTLFSVNTDGSNFTVLHTFQSSDGANPVAGLLLISNRLYGTAENGGVGGGTIFSINTNGNDFSVVHALVPLSEGEIPEAGLCLAGNTLYGAAVWGGPNSAGTLFSVNTDGSQFAVLHAFPAVSADPSGVYTNAEGANPAGGLVLANQTLYGLTEEGGTNGSGTIFSLNTDGTGFSVLYTFSSNVISTNADGAYPFQALTVAGDTLYGTTEEGGANGIGTVFSIKTNGTGFQVLHTFAPRGYSPVAGITNADGAFPDAQLLLLGDTLYGCTERGGQTSSGTLFSLGQDGSNFTVLHSFSAVPTSSPYTNADGEIPDAGFPGLVLSSHTLYGTTSSGGAYGAGTVFSLPLVPTITGVNVSRTNLVLELLNGVAGESFTLLTSADVAQPMSGWTPVSTNVFPGSALTVVVTNQFNPAVPNAFYTLKVQ